MPCNAVLQQTGTLSLAPGLLLQEPEFLNFVAERLALAQKTPVALCTPANWSGTYIRDLAQQPLAGFDFPGEGALFFAQAWAVALYPDGRIELRDGTRVGARPANAEQLLAQVAALLNTATGVALQKVVATQLATLGTITQRQQAPNGSLIVSLTV